MAALGLLAGSIVMLGVALGPTARAWPAADKPLDTATIMELKLKYSKEILAGLAREDFAVIEKQASDLVLLSHESNWQVLQSFEYQRHSADFRRFATALAKDARDRNLDAATLSYLQLTTSCTQCHKYVRDVQAPK